MIPMAAVNSTHRVGLIVKELLPASAKRGSNSTPFVTGDRNLSHFEYYAKIAYYTSADKRKRWTPKTLSHNCPAKSLTSAVFTADGTMGQWDKLEMKGDPRRYDKGQLPVISRKLCVLCISASVHHFENSISC